MDSTQARPNTVNPRLTLSARQEELLFAALNSNNKVSNLDTSSLQSKDQFSMAPGSFTESPLQAAPGSGTLNGFEESPFIDYDYEFDGDGSFDYGDFNNDSQAQMIGNLPGTSSDGGDNENHDKRSHPDDDGEEEEGGGKRREGDEKAAKKPGRKPLTSEPTSKRKAQNRAAQRAFRERKEKHLKDLETKVEDLEKASESANHENSILRAQIEKMSMELREYRKRLSLNGGAARTSLTNGLPPYLANSFGNGGLNNPNDVNFQFEFPRFGRLPGPAATTANPTRSSSSPSVASKQAVSPVEKGQISPRNQSLQYPTKPTMQSPVYNKPLDSTLTTIGEEHPAATATGEGELTFCDKLNMACGNPNNPIPRTMSEPGANSGNFDTPAFDINGIDWFAQQNNNQFDPQLFGDYREPQDNILSNEPFGDTFFTDAFALGDFTSPFNMAPSPAPPKKDLVAQIDEKQNEDDEVVPGEDTTQMLSCNTIWDRLQACPKVKEGEFDLDLLCKDLQKKAKCSETGAVVNESDFNKIMKSYVDGPAKNASA
ncbi:PAP1-domain-containing protein [Cadophora sp. DSE1049]|nr:PAP1-domain-containing protein [Cadophora sp. DSE1049]